MEFSCEIFFLGEEIFYDGRGGIFEFFLTRPSLQQVSRLNTLFVLFFPFASSSNRPVARTQYTYHANVRMLRKIAARVWCFCGPRKFARSGLKNRKTKKKILNALYVRRRAQWTTEEKNDLPTHQLWRAKR